MCRRPDCGRFRTADWRNSNYTAAGLPCHSAPPAPGREIHHHVFAAHANLGRSRRSHFCAGRVQRIQYRCAAFLFDAEPCRAPVIDRFIAFHVAAIPFFLRQNLVACRRSPALGECIVGRLVKRQILERILGCEHLLEVALYVEGQAHFITDLAVFRNRNGAQGRLARRQLNRLPFHIQGRFRRCLSAVERIIDGDNLRRILIRFRARAQRNKRGFFVFAGLLIRLRRGRRRNDDPYNRRKSARSAYRFR